MRKEIEEKDKKIEELTSIIDNYKVLSLSTIE